MDNDFLKIHSIKQNEHIMVIDINGRLDESTFDLFVNEINNLNQVKFDLIIDLTDLKYISSSGIRAIFDLRSEMILNKQKLAIIGASERIIHIFSLLGLWKSFDHFDNIEDAIKFIQK